jgi:hypothetical protein
MRRNATARLRQLVGETEPTPLRRTRPMMVRPGSFNASSSPLDVRDMNIVHVDVPGGWKRAPSAMLKRERRIFVIPASGHIPVKPVTTPKPQLSFRARRLAAAPLATGALLVEKTPFSTMPRSRSAAIRRDRGLSAIDATEKPIALPPKILQRARSAPVLRVAESEVEMPGRSRRSLGDSLRMSNTSAVMMPRASAPLSLAQGLAARMYFDPGTGRSIALRC